MLDQHKLSEPLLTQILMTVTSWGKQKSWIFGDMTAFSTSNTQKYHPIMVVSFSNFPLRYNAAFILQYYFSVLLSNYLLE